MRLGLARRLRHGIRLLLKATPSGPAPAPTTLPTTEGWQPATGPAATHTFAGGWFHDPAEGRRWWVKRAASDDQLRAEHLANRLYRRAGVLAPETRLVQHQGQLHLASEAVPGATTHDAGHLSQHPDVHAGFAADAWLANWDAVGLSNSNLLGDHHGNVWRIDHGGSLHFRAQGKPKAFGPTVGEIDSLRDPAINPEASAVFGKVPTASIVAGVARIKAIPDAVIDHEVTRAGLPATLAQTLKARRDHLAAQYMVGLTKGATS